MTSEKMDTPSLFQKTKKQHILWILHLDFATTSEEGASEKIEKLRMEDEEQSNR